MAVIIRKRVSLADIGDDFKDSYIVFKGYSKRDLKEKLAPLAEVEKDKSAESGLKAFDLMVELLKDNFIEGKIMHDDGNLKDVEKSDFDDFPTEIIQMCMSFLSQAPTPKNS